MSGLLWRAWVSGPHLPLVTPRGYFSRSTNPPIFVTKMTHGDTHPWGESRGHNPITHLPIHPPGDVTPGALGFTNVAPASTHRRHASTIWGRVSRQTSRMTFTTTLGGNRPAFWVAGVMVCREGRAPQPSSSANAKKNNQLDRLRTRSGRGAGSAQKLESLA